MESTQSPARSDDWARRLVWVSLALGCLPIVAAVYHGLADHWYPTGDNGYFVIRARDVLTRHHPLVGAWSSGSLSIAESVNNLGPLQLDLLAPFSKIGVAAGTVIGVGTVQLASVVGIWATLRRLTTAAVVVAAMAMVAAIEWSMGSALLLETRQHPYLVLPFLCLLVLVWAVSSGALWALPWAAFVASLVIQTHLSYVFFFAGLTLWGLAALGAVMWRRRRHDPAGWPEQRSRVLRSSLLTALVITLCWIQPIIDQFFGRGNLGKVLSVESDTRAPGFKVGAEIVATVLTRPPWWLRPQFRDFDPLVDRASDGYAFASLSAVAALLAAAAWLMWTRRDRVAFTGVATAMVALAIGLVSASRLVGSDFGLNVGNYRWLWSLGAFIVIALVSACVSATGIRTWTHPDRVVTLGLAAATLILAVLAVPYSYEGDFIDGAPRIDAIHRLLPQLEDLDVDGVVLFDRSRSSFSEPYSYPILISLQEQGIDFEVAGDEDVRRFGGGREPDGDATVRLSIVIPDMDRAVPGERRVASLDGLAPELLRQHDDLLEQIVDGAEAGRIELDVDGAVEESGRDLPQVAALLEGGHPKRGRCADRSTGDLADELAVVVRLNAFSAASGDGRAISRWLQLYNEDCLQKVGIYVSPL